MIKFKIPGGATLEIEHLVCDVNGTLAVDGNVPAGLERIFARLRARVEIHLLTADTHGKQASIDRQLNLQATRVQRGHEAEQKSAYIKELGAQRVIAIGQGANDAEMLQTAAIGVAILSQEGLATATLLAADLVVPDIYAALDLLEKPLRLVATLRK